MPKRFFSYSVTQNNASPFTSSTDIKTTAEKPQGFSTTTTVFIITTVQAVNRLASHRFNKHNGGKAVRLFYYYCVYYNNSASRQSACFTPFQ
jgi:hypothetical protein